MASQAVRVRFAPSPTGYLHVGGVRTVLFNYFFAKKEGGTFILRIDDTDPVRSQPEFEEDILSQLAWLGVTPDEGPYRQSERQERYQELGKKLLEDGKAYQDEDGSIRMQYTGDTVSFDDLVYGVSNVPVESLGPELVLLRADGSATFHLASVCDDIDMKISHILRGSDHFTNTAKHVLLYQAIGEPLPTFAHLPLILGSDGTKLSKRNSGGNVLVREFRELGYLPEALKNFLMLLGWSHPEEKEQFTDEEAAECFELRRVNTSGAVFELGKLRFLNAWWIRHLPLNDIVERSREFLGDYRELVESRGSQFWARAVEVLRERFQTLADARTFACLIFDLELPLSDAAKEFLSNAEQREVFDSVSAQWKNFLGEMSFEGENNTLSVEQFTKIQSILKKEISGQKKSLFQSLRILTMGDVSGPDLKAFVPLLTREVLLSRAESNFE